MRTPLHIACANNQINVVKFLIETNTKINPIDRWGATPLNDAKN